MDLLKSLGIDNSVAVQFVLFCALYFMLSRLVFRPYFAAFLKRSERTVGNTEAAEKLLSEGQVLEAEYQRQAKRLNSEIKKIYDDARLSVQRETESSLQKARESARVLIEQTRQQVLRELQAAQPQIKSEAANLSRSIVKKLLGKELAI